MIDSLKHRLTFHGNIENTTVFLWGRVWGVWLELILLRRDSMPEAGGVGIGMESNLGLFFLIKLGACKGGGSEADFVGTLVDK